MKTAPPCAWMDVWASAEWGLGGWQSSGMMMTVGNGLDAATTLAPAWCAGACCCCCWYRNSRCQSDSRSVHPSQPICWAAASSCSPVVDVVCARPTGICIINVSLPLHPLCLLLARQHFISHIYASLPLYKKTNSHDAVNGQYRTERDC